MRTAEEYAFWSSGPYDASQGVFLQSQRGYVRVSRCHLPHALPTNELCWHNELLRRQIRLLDSSQRELGEMNAQLFGKLAHGCEAGMQDFANRVIETRDADVIRDSDSRLLQRLIYARSGLIGADKECRGPLSAGQQCFYGQVPELAIFRANLAETRFEISLFHGLTITASAPREPRQALVPDVPDVAMTLRDEIAGDVCGPTDVVGEDAIVVLRLPVAHDVVADEGEGNFFLRQCRQDIGRMRSAQNDPARAVRRGQNFR